MKVLLTTLGSAGDIHPFLAIGQNLLAHGHDIEMMTNPVFEGLVRQAGLSFFAVGTAEHYADTVKSPKLWHPVDGFGVFWRRMARHAIEPVFQRIAEKAADGPCVVCATPLMLGARLAQEKLKVPLVTAYTAATQLRSCEHPLTMARWRVPRWIPKTARRIAWQALDRWKLEPMVAGDLAPIRARLGLPLLTHSVFGQWVHSPTAGVTLFPAWFATAPCDWPSQVRQAGFPLYDGDVAQGLAPDLIHFLQEGDPPIVFTPGSAMRHGHEFFRAAVRSSLELGRRGVLLTNDASQIPQNLPKSIHYSQYAPFGELLPRACALVHHGGIGNSAQAMRAGIPQLLTPMGFDQFDNAMRIELLGVGTMLSRRDHQFTTMMPQLRELLENSHVAMTCRQTVKKFAADNPIHVVRDVLEAAA